MTRRHTPRRPIRTAQTSGSGGAVAAPPTLASVNTAWGTYKGGSSRVLTGTNFDTVVGAAGVTFGGVNATSYVVDNSTQITAVVPAATSDLAGAVDIVVTNPDGSATLSAAYEYTSIGRAAEVAGGAGTKYAVFDPGVEYTLNGSDCSALNDLGNLATQLDVTQGTASAQPAWSATSGANGKAGLTYVTADSQRLYKTTAGGFASGTGFTMGSVVNFTAIGAIQGVFTTYNFGGSTSTGHRTDITAAGKARAIIHDGTSQKTAEGATTLVAGTTYLIEGTINTVGSNTARVYVNGVDDDATPPALAAATIGNTGELVHLGSVGGANYLGGVISYAYAFAANLTTDSALVLERFFEETFALAITTRTI